MPILTREFKAKAVPYFSGKTEAFATTLVSALVMMYGIEALTWDPLTIQLELKDDLELEMPRKVYDKMMALVIALTTDSVYKDVAFFDETVNALTGKGVGVDRSIPSVDEVAWAVTELSMNDPEPVGRDPEKRYGSDIARYVRVVLDDEGMTRAPKVLAFAKSKPVKKEGMEDPAMYASAWGSAQARADEVDTWAESMSVKLLHQLMDIGVAFNEHKPQEDAFESSAEAPVRINKPVPKVASPKNIANRQLTAMVRAKSARALH